MRRKLTQNGDKVRLSLWRSPSPSSYFEAQCQFWCEDHSPEKGEGEISAEEAEEEMLRSLVKK